MKTRALENGEDVPLWARLSSCAPVANRRTGGLTTRRKLPACSTHLLIAPVGLVALILTGCSNHAPERLDRLYDAAAAHVRAGDLPRAQVEAERGMSLAAGRHELWFDWRFRLL